MELTILGSGTYKPELKRHASSYLVKINKQNLVFDFGRGVLDNLLKIGVNYYDIDEIFITHTHSDHCAELISYLHVALGKPLKGKVREKDITIYGPVGFKEVMNYFYHAFHLKKFKYRIFIRELRNLNSIVGKGWKLKCYSTNHSKILKSLAYRLESKNKVLAYSGDTTDCLGLRQACNQADLAILEASWPKALKAKDHLTGEEAGKIAQKVGIKKLVLTHMAPYYLENFDVKGEAKKFYNGPVILAKDLMKIKI